jgi:hypothetical protein
MSRFMPLRWMTWGPSFRRGVTEFVTASVKDFEGFGFVRVWNPLEP